MATETYDVTNPDKPTIGKDPDAVLDYSENWTTWLLRVTDTIDTAELVLKDPACTLSLDPAHPAMITDGLIVTAWLIGGRPGVTENATFRIHTVAGRTDDRTLYFKVKDR